MCKIRVIYSASLSEEQREATSFLTEAHYNLVQVLKNLPNVVVRPYTFNGVGRTSLAEMGKKYVSGDGLVFGREESWAARRMGQGIGLTETFSALLTRCRQDETKHLIIVTHGADEIDPTTIIKLKRMVFQSRDHGIKIRVIAHGDGKAIAAVINWARLAGLMHTELVFCQEERPDKAITFAYQVASHAFCQIQASMNSKALV